MTLTIIPVDSLPEATTLNDVDKFVVSQGGVVKKISSSNIRSASSIVSADRLGEISSTYSGSMAYENLGISEIHIKHVSGTPTFKIGSTDGGGDLLNETDPITTDSYLPVFIPCYDTTAIYPRVAGTGTINVTLILHTNIY